MISRHSKAIASILVGCQILVLTQLFMVSGNSTHTINREDLRYEPSSKAYTEENTIASQAGDIDYIQVKLPIADSDGLEDNELYVIFEAVIQDVLPTPVPSPRQKNVFADLPLNLATTEIMTDENAQEVSIESLEPNASILEVPEQNLLLMSSDENVNIQSAEQSLNSYGREREASVYVPTNGDASLSYTQYAQNYENANDVVEPDVNTENDGGYTLGTDRLTVDNGNFTLGATDMYTENSGIYAFGADASIANDVNYPFEAYAYDGINEDYVYEIDAGSVANVDSYAEDYEYFVSEADEQEEINLQDNLQEADVNFALLEWDEVQKLLPTGEDITIVDVRTGVSFNIRVMSKGRHADVEPSTQEDTNIKHETRDGVWSWAARPVWVMIGDLTIPASINGRPHAGSTIRNNGVNGHFCLWFVGSRSTGSRSVSYRDNMLNAVTEAWDARPTNTIETQYDEPEISYSPSGD